MGQQYPPCAPPNPVETPAAYQGMLDKYCVTCHNQKARIPAGAPLALDTAKGTMTRRILMIALNMLAQLCAGPTSALTWALYADVADYGEVKYGRRSTGLIYSASLFSIKAGILIGGFLVPLFLARFGYVKGVETQTARALMGIAIAFSIGPALFALLKCVALMIYPLNQKRVDEIERELAARRASASELKPA